MPNPIPSAALPLAHLLLRLSIILNWLAGTAIVVLLLVSPHEQWIMSAFKIAPGPDTSRLIGILRAIAALGLVAIPVNYAILKRLLALVATVRAGNPFIGANAERLRAIAWAMLGLQGIGLCIFALARLGSSPEHPLHIGTNFSLNGFLAVLLTFLLSRVFAEGAHMREDLDGTV
ncbi:MAG TPA: DUF2975 domain-containing protein [Steroidobacteraceae bacterium]|jgi:hypothetical protein|nr:DUF2975 domain-containing protein [Steroidobacteraceae bacterium]